MSYFYNKATGLNADIERHRQKETELQNRIEELETKDDKFSKIVLASYRSLLLQLQQSKAEILIKLGDKK